MSCLNYLSRIIKNPKFILNGNFLLHPFASLSTAMKIITNNDTLMQCVNKLTKESVDKLSEYYNDISGNIKLQKHIDQQFESFNEFIIQKNLKNSIYSKENPAGRINRQSQGNAGFFLYVLIRSMKPDIVVETGVSSGESSTFILQAMEDNKKGKLYSIDLPPESDQQDRMIIFPPGKTSGWVIPDDLRHRWELNLGTSQKLLLPLLQKLKSIDIFFHDSLHTYDHMMFEYETSWDFIRNGGILISDDIYTMNGKGHSPFVDFVNIKGKEIAIYQIIGGVRKS